MDTEPVGVGCQRFVAIGIDFGTTFCGVSWADSADPKEIHHIAEWPAQYHSSGGEVQVPTLLDLASGKWGHEVTPDMKPIKWFKLLLLKDADIKPDEIRNSSHRLDARRQIDARRLSPVKVVSIYLEKLWGHTVKHLAGKLDIDTVPFRVAITVPAIWPPDAVQAMREAAKLSKITEERDIGPTTLDLVQEPEAAALSIFQDRMNEIKPGESFVICDAGGGTVDVISYTVESLTPFRIKECIQGDGKLAGAYKVDEAFTEHLQWSTRIRLDSLRIEEHNSFFTQQWELGLKRNFTGELNSPKFILTPPMRAIGTIDRLKRRGDIEISRERMEGFFDQSFTGIRVLISDQRKGVEKVTGSKPKQILLVGGFGSSQYIYNQLCMQFDNTVLRPKNTWSAVAHGAVIRLLHDTMSNDPNLSGEQQASISRIPEVIARKSRYSYGIEYNEYVDNLPDFDSELDGVVITPEGQRSAPRMRWYLFQGDEVGKKEPVLFEFIRFATAKTLGKKCQFTILYSQSESEGVVVPPPIRRDKSVLELCKIECDWDKPFDEWEAVAGNGTEGTGSYSGTGWRKHTGLKLAMRFGGQPKFTLQVGNNETEKDVKVEYSG
ncbi:hypothetical protein QBC44DRAFT_329723 [Cladorrhinum sp. PSN332]|nr:hypothetical protein QBC44DRAFT_329723 [Cladorrhinum sp. PSN332]